MLPALAIGRQSLRMMELHRRSVPRFSSSQLLFCQMLGIIMCVSLAASMRRIPMLSFDRDQEIRSLCQTLVLQSR